MKKYKFVGYERTTMEDYPLSPGQMSAKIVEDENGKLFSEVISEYLDPKDKSLKDMAEMDNFNIIRCCCGSAEISKLFLEKLEMKVITPDDIAEIAFGFRPLDEKSKEHRIALTNDPTMQILQNAKRPYAALTYKGIPVGNVNKLCNQFDGVSFDLRNSTVEELNDNIVPLMAIFQREKPTMYIISAEVANAMKGAIDAKESPALKQLEFKATVFKNVFAPKEGLENNFIRSL